MSEKRERPIIDVIAAEIGTEATLALVMKHGGKIKRIPHQPSPWMLEALSRDDAIKLCATFHEEVIAIPKASAWRRARRDREIIEAYEAHLAGRPYPEGKTIHQLVEQYDLTEWAIRQILKRPTPARPPGMLLSPDPDFGGLAHRRDPDTVDMFKGGEELES